MGGPQFLFTYEPTAKGFRLTVVQSQGDPVLKPEGMVFTARSLAAAERKADDFITDLELSDWATSFDYDKVLSPSDLAAVQRALEAQDALQRAEYQMVRAAYDAAEPLQARGFSVRDIGVLLLLSKSEIHNVLREGAFYAKIEAERERQRRKDDRSFEKTPPPAWYLGSSWEQDKVLSPGAALAWDWSLPHLQDDLKMVPFEESYLYAALPDRFRDRYDAGFISRFVEVVSSVHERIVTGDYRWVSPAEEIAVAVLEYVAIAVAEINYDMGLRITKKSDRMKVRDLREYIVEDIDVEFLWGAEWDGIEEDSEAMAVMDYDNQLRFENWFKPYRSSEEGPGDGSSPGP